MISMGQENEMLPEISSQGENDSLSQSERIAHTLDASIISPPSTPTDIPDLASTMFQMDGISRHDQQTLLDSYMTLNSLLPRLPKHEESHTNLEHDTDRQGTTSNPALQPDEELWKLL
jgi:hypothetical protein